VFTACTTCFGLKSENLGRLLCMIITINKDDYPKQHNILIRIYNGDKVYSFDVRNEF
jgi:hypothetical protein